MSPQNELGQYIPIHYHFQMLTDELRMCAFEEAIRRVVKPGYKVVDLGSGTGALSFFAAKQGAEVIGVENNPDLVDHSRSLLRENGVEDQVEIIQADAEEWTPDDPVDVVICEMLHSALLREKEVQVIQRFRERHEQWFGIQPKFIPAATLLAVQPVWVDYSFHGYEAPLPFFEDAYSNSQRVFGQADPYVFAQVDYSLASEQVFEVDKKYQIEPGQSINGLRFITKNILSMNLKEGTSVDWQNQHLIIPLRRRIDVSTGDEIRLKFRVRPGGSIEDLMKAIEVITDNWSEKK